MSPRFDMYRAITKAILETIGTDFLLKDGSRAMTGNLTLPNPGKIFFGTGAMLEGTTYQVAVRNFADDDYLNFACNVMYAKYFRGLTATSQIRVYQDVNGLFNLDSYNGASWVRYAIFGGSDDALAILRAGDITLLTGKVLNGGLGEVDVDYDTLSADPWPVPIDTPNNGALRVIKNTGLAGNPVRLYVYAGKWVYVDLT